MHPQTLRTYDRMGLVSPRRTAKRGRRYSARDVAMLRMIQRLSQDEGINLEGIRRILAMERELEALRAQVTELAELLAAARQAPPCARVFTATGRRRTPAADRIPPDEPTGDHLSLILRSLIPQTASAPRNLHTFGKSAHFRKYADFPEVRRLPPGVGSAGTGPNELDRAGTG